MKLANNKQGRILSTISLTLFLYHALGYNYVMLTKKIHFLD